MSHIFISYAHEDNPELAEQLYDALVMAQHSVFRSLENEIEIEHEIKACDLFVILVTVASNESRGVYQEFKLAEQSGKTIFPIMVETGLPPYLADYDAVEHKGSDITPIIREIELLALTSDRQRERKQWRNALLVVTGIAIIVIAYLAMRSQINTWVYDTFVPTPTPTFTFTPRPTRTTFPTNTPRPTATPVPRVFIIEGGGEIVFSRTVREEMDVFYEEIFLLNLETGEETQLTDDGSDNNLPSWSPDGSQIVFETMRDGNYEIYVMNADGSNPTRLTFEKEAEDRRPRWSPDGTQIAFESNREDDTFQIYVMDVDGSNQEELTSSRNDNHAPVWSPDGSQIAFYTRRYFPSAYMIMNADGSDQEAIEFDDEFTPSAFTVSWSLDGSQFVFSHIVAASREIFVMDTDGDNFQRLTDLVEDTAYPSWTADGTQILFRMGSGVFSRFTTDIYIMDADGSNMRQVTNTPENEVFFQIRPESP